VRSFRASEGRKRTVLAEVLEGRVAVEKEAKKEEGCCRRFFCGAAACRASQARERASESASWISEDAFGVKVGDFCTRMIRNLYIKCD
jgi:hypothetical protein